MSVIDPNFRIYLYEFQRRQFEKAAANPVARTLRRGLFYGLKKALKTGWKPALLAAGIGIPLLVGSKVIQHKPTTREEEVRERRHSTLMQGAGVPRNPTFPPRPMSHLRR